MKPEFLEELLSFGILFSTLSGKLIASARPESLTPMQFEILQIVHSSGRSTLTELCGCTKLSMPNASREVRKLFEIELVEKEEDAKDKRIHWIVLSEDGKKLVDEAYGVLGGVFMERYGSYSEDDLHKMTECLAYLRGKL